jgi:hypothetical protein
LSTTGFQAIFPLVGQNQLPIRWAEKRILRTLGMLLMGVLVALQVALQVPLQAASPASTSPNRLDPHAWDKAPEPVTFALIGGVLCLVGLRLRRRKE